MAGSIVTLPYACGMETDARLFSLTGEAMASFDQKSDRSGDSFYMYDLLPEYSRKLCGGELHTVSCLLKSAFGVLLRGAETGINQNIDFIRNTLTQIGYVIGSLNNKKGRNFFNTQGDEFANKSYILNLFVATTNVFFNETSQRLSELEDQRKQLHNKHKEAINRINEIIADNVARKEEKERLDEEYETQKMQISNEVENIERDFSERLREITISNCIEVNLPEWIADMCPRILRGEQDAVLPVTIARSMLLLIWKRISLLGLKAMTRMRDFFVDIRGIDVVEYSIDPLERLMVMHSHEEKMKKIEASLLDRMKAYIEEIHLYREQIGEDLIKLINTDEYEGISKICSVPEKEEAYNRLYTSILDAFDALFRGAIIVHNGCQRLQRGEPVDADWVSNIPEILIKGKQKYEEDEKQKRMMRKKQEKQKKAVRKKHKKQSKIVQAVPLREDNDDNTEEKA